MRIIFLTVFLFLAAKITLHHFIHTSNGHPYFDHRIQCLSTNNFHNPNIRINIGGINNRYSRRNCLSNRKQHGQYTNKYIKTTKQKNTVNGLHHHPSNLYHNYQHEYTRGNNKVIINHNIAKPHDTLLQKVQKYVNNKKQRVIGNIGMESKNNQLSWNRHGVISNVANKYNTYPLSYEAKIVQNTAKQILGNRNVLKHKICHDNIPKIINEGNKWNIDTVNNQEQNRNITDQVMNRSQISANQVETINQNVNSTISSQSSQNQSLQRLQDQAIQRHRDNVNRFISQSQTTTQQQAAPQQQVTAQQPQSSQKNQQNNITDNQQEQSLQQLQEQAIQRHRENLQNFLNQESNDQEESNQSVQNPVQQQEWNNREDVPKQQHKSCAFCDSWTHHMKRRFDLLEAQMMARHKKQIQRRLKALHSSVGPSNKQYGKRSGFPFSSSSYNSHRHHKHKKSCPRIKRCFNVSIK